METKMFTNLHSVRMMQF